MLAHLSISNFAIISRLTTHLKPGLNILSGETGAGKSIIINAVNLILGARASSDLIRTGADEARVEALFRIPPDSPLERSLKDLGYATDGEMLMETRFVFVTRRAPPRTCTLRSVIRLEPEGRNENSGFSHAHSKAFLNHRVCDASWRSDARGHRGKKRGENKKGTSSSVISVPSVVSLLLGFRA